MTGYSVQHKHEQGIYKTSRMDGAMECLVSWGFVFFRVDGMYEVERHNKISVDSDLLPYLSG